ncbi:MAG TPA: hypothetical protein VMW06_01700 [Desulfobacterales bacterium]|nr:hypothetical protein [Desulfobacterales bacterium]
MSHETIVFQIQLGTTPFHPNCTKVEGNSRVKSALFALALDIKFCERNAGTLNRNIRMAGG